MEVDIKEFITKYAKEPYYIPGERTKSGKDLYVVRVDYEKVISACSPEDLRPCLKGLKKLLDEYVGECIIIPMEVDFAREIEVRNLLKSLLKEN